MSRILFLCSGNTCRSALAAGIAQRMFGPSHTISSADAEAAYGLTAAKNAIMAAAEMGIDISTHLSADAQDVEVGNFDIIVIFRPSTAESIPLPATVPIAYLYTQDPYGGTLDDYRSAARLIQRGVRRVYVEDLRRRVSTLGGPMGSHLAGILNRAANECEREVKEFVNRRLSRPVHDKATLGQLGRSIKEHGRAQDGADLTDLAEAVCAANQVWRQVKHLDSTTSQLVDGLAAIQKVFQLLDRLSASRDAPSELVSWKDVANANPRAERKPV